MPAAVMPAPASGPGDGRGSGEGGGASPAAARYDSISSEWCLLMCRLRLLTVLKTLPHVSQTVRPLWMDMWLMREPRLE